MNWKNYNVAFYGGMMDEKEKFTMSSGIRFVIVENVEGIGITDIEIQNQALLNKWI